MDAWLRVDSLWEFDCPELLSRKACDILLSVRMQSPKSGGINRKIDVTHEEEAGQRHQGRCGRSLLIQ